MNSRFTIRRLWRWLWRGLRILAWLPSLLLGPLTDAQAARIGGAAPTVLVVDQWIATGAQGQVLQSGLQARLRGSGSAADGLVLGWAPALDRSIDATGLGLVALPWVDPPLRTSAVQWFQDDQHDPPQDTPQIRIARLSALATARLQDAAPALAARLVATLKDQGSTEGWFNFRQSLPVLGQARQVTWGLHVAASGTWFSGTPAIDAPGAAVLHVSYVALAAAAGLPAAYRYQDAGRLRWQLADTAGHDLPGGGGRDTAGAFDGPAGLDCLLGVRASGCDPRQEGVPGLMERLGAAQADVTVTSALKPVFVVTAGGQRLAVARLQVARTLQGSGSACAMPPWQYTNAWQAAFQLDALRTRYTLAAGGKWQSNALDRVRLAGPLVPWKTLHLPVSAPSLAALDPLVIDPDRGQLVRRDSYPAGVQDLVTSPIDCLPSGSTGTP